LPRKTFAAVLTGGGALLAGLSGGTEFLGSLLYGLAASGLHLAAFGLDPLSDKRVEGIDSFQQDRVARVVEEAEGYLAAIREQIASLGDRALETRVAGFEALARRMIRTVEEDPRTFRRRAAISASTSWARATRRSASPSSTAAPATPRLARTTRRSWATSRPTTPRHHPPPRGGREAMDLEIKVCATAAPRRRDDRPIGEKADVRHHPRGAQAALAQAEKVTAVILPEPRGQRRGPLEQATPASPRRSAAHGRDRPERDRLHRGLRLQAQGELQQISQSMLQGVRNKDVGPAGNALREIVSTIRGFSTAELDTRASDPSGRSSPGRAAPIAKFTARFEEVQGQIDRITDDLLKHEHALLKDIESLDQLYDKTLAFYDELALYIAAGEAKLRSSTPRPSPPRRPRCRPRPGPGRHGGPGAARPPLRPRRPRARVHDLKLTRQVTMQSLPSIRLVQENDKSLVTKINSTW
jgi:hypothetical protein